MAAVYHRSFAADRGDGGQRLDRVVQRHVGGAAGTIARAEVQRWIARGAVRVNGIPVRRSAARAAWGDVVTIEMDPPVRRRSEALAEPAELELLYEDDHLLAVNKPAGIVVHPTYGHASGTVLNALLWRARDWPSPARPSLVGRLDRLTSGLLIVAKTRAMHAALQRELRSSSAEKEYLALVYGRVPAAPGRIDLPLRRDPDDRRRVQASPADGRPSLTHFERIACAAAPRAGIALLRCRLATGRMHQIRAHLAARGWPIVGDPVYGEPRWSRVTDPALAARLRDFPRQALHAWRVAFRHPVTGTRVQIEAPVPRDLSEVLACVGAWRA